MSARLRKKTMSKSLNTQQQRSNVEVENSDLKEKLYLESRKLEDVLAHLKNKEIEYSKLEERFNLFNDALYQKKKENQNFSILNSNLSSKVKELELELQLKNEKISSLKAKVDNLNANIRKLIKSSNEIISSFNERVVKLSNTQIMLSYNIGKAILDLKEKEGVKSFLPRIFNAKTALKQKDSLKEQYLNKFNANDWVIENDFELSSNTFSLKDLEKLASEIPDSNGSAYYSKIPLNVAIVTDEFMFNYYNGVFENLIYINPLNYKSILEKENIDVFMYVTCWSGMEGEDWRGIKYREKPKQAFDEILAFCNKNKIPTIFQSIEDPSNYESFLPLAVRFDNIFTSAIETIDNYKAACGHNNVFYGEYGFNPTLNNPIGSYRSVYDSVFFAGSYPQRYKERCDDMEIMFDSVVESNGNLVIADRNFSLADESLKFPKKYSSFVIDKIEHKLLQRVHKLFRYNANFNSIKDSSTMCAMRVYELQAQGTIILSNYALSLSNKFPNIKLVNQKENLASLFKGNQKIDISELIFRCNTIRGIFKTKSVFNQTANMLNMCGINVKTSEPKVLVIKDAKDYNFTPQTLSNYTVKSKGENINLAEYDFVACVSSENEYSRFYLEDLLNGFKYTDVDFVTKHVDISSGEVQGEIYEYTSQYKDINKLMVKSSFFDLKSCGVNSKNGFVVEPFNIDDCIVVDGKDKYDLSIVIPVYNNGVFLRDRCIRSLLLDDNFSKFEILLIDDGSTDSETISIISDLEKSYKNIKPFYYPKGGSGSASRARNQGINIASSEFITFLDPDNEISAGGYTKLINLFNQSLPKHPDIDFVTGYQNKIMGNIVRTAYHTDKDSSFMKDPKAHLVAKKYPIISTQAFIAKKSLLKDNHISFIEKAVGQDTLFGHEVMGYSKGCIFTGSVYINYYAERVGSVTNTLDLKFFEKSLVLEKNQVSSLKKVGLYENYRDQKFPIFYEKWYLEKLKLVSPQYEKGAKLILDEIKSLYI
ncbi:glycosyltransferase [Acinetobacter higginsii]|uniref:glycosyltransferase n=1 Tax=Acinetobacter higginsii TaxID=70347 RepID=UPI001F4A0D7C|nr:glycosyltransferase [Acinetobacter higginsii]MCH7296614.1 glycosyltransferase [Acinetobacter higginsii]